MSQCKSPTCAMELGKRDQDIEWLRAQLKAEKEAHERHSSLNGELALKLAEAQALAAHVKGEFNLRDQQARRCADDYGALQAKFEIAVKALNSAASMAQHIIETAQRDKWSSNGLEFGCSHLEREVREALLKVAGATTRTEGELGQESGQGVQSCPNTSASKRSPTRIAIGEVIPGLAASEAMLRGTKFDCLADDLRAIRHELSDSVQNEREESVGLQERLDRAVALLEFYANPENFFQGLEPDKDGDLYPIGARARVFLDPKHQATARPSAPLREWTLNVNQADEIRGAGDVLSAHVGSYYSDNEYVRVREVRKG